MQVYLNKTLIISLVQHNLQNHYTRRIKNFLSHSSFNAFYNLCTDIFQKLHVNRTIVLKPVQVRLEQTDKSLIAKHSFVNKHIMDFNTTKILHHTIAK